MKSEYIISTIILLINIVIIILITILNSDISNYGVFLYLPGLFFINASLYLNNIHGIIVSIFTGLFIDVILTTPFGFHAILLSFCFLLGKNWMLQNLNTKPWRCIIFQLSINIMFNFILLVTFKFRHELSIDWSISRFITDLIISSLIFIPIAFWKTEINTVIIDYISTKIIKTEQINEIK